MEMFYVQDSLDDRLSSLSSQRNTIPKNECVYKNPYTAEVPSSAGRLVVDGGSLNGPRRWGPVLWDSLGA